MAKKAESDFVNEDDAGAATTLGAATTIKTALTFTARKEGEAWAPTVNPSGSGKSATIATGMPDRMLAVVIAEAIGLPKHLWGHVTLNGTLTLGIKRSGMSDEGWAKAQKRGRDKSIAAEAKAAATEEAKAAGL